MNGLCTIIKPGEDESLPGHLPAHPGDKHFNRHSGA